MNKLASIVPNRLDVRLGGDTEQFVNLQFHQGDDHVDVIVNRHQIPGLIDQLQRVMAHAGEAKASD